MILKTKTLSPLAISVLGAAFIFTAKPVLADEYVSIGEYKFSAPAEVAVASMKPVTMEPVTTRPVTATSTSVASIRTTSVVEDDPIVYTKSLQSRVEAFRRAMVEADIDVLDDLADEDLSFGHSNGVIQSKQDFIDMVRNGDEVFLTLELSDKEVSQTGNLSIERHIFTSDIVIGGETISVELNILEVWRNGAKGWRLIARQAYKV